MENQINMFDKTNTEKFNEFDRANPEVYKLFVNNAFQLINAGKKIISQRLIVEKIRWDVYLETRDDNSTFKINNNYISHYGRKFVREFPEHTGRFRFRTQRKA